MFAFSTSIQTCGLWCLKWQWGCVCASADFWFTRCVFIRCYSFHWHADCTVTVSTCCVMIVRLSWFTYTVQCGNPPFRRLFKITRFFALDYIRADSFVLISQTWICACGAFRKSLCVISASLFVCLFVCCWWWFWWWGLVCLQCHLASDIPPQSHLIAASVCLRCYHGLLG